MFFYFDDEQKSGTPQERYDKLVAEEKRQLKEKQSKCQHHYVADGSYCCLHYEVECYKCIICGHEKSHQFRD
jgi:hypothetical protein